MIASTSRVATPSDDGEQGHFDQSPNPSRMDVAILGKDLPVEKKLSRSGVQSTLLV